MPLFFANYEFENLEPVQVSVIKILFNQHGSLVAIFLKDGKIFSTDVDRLTFVRWA
jgi:hypothetical protein